MWIYKGYPVSSTKAKTLDAYPVIYTLSGGLGEAFVMSL